MVRAATFPLPYSSQLNSACGRNEDCTCIAVIVGVGRQEAYQLLENCSASFCPVPNLAMFANPLIAWTHVHQTDGVDAGSHASETGGCQGCCASGAKTVA